MEITPIKSSNTKLVAEQLTPVRFLDGSSPITVKSPAAANSCKSRLETIIKSLSDDYAKWKRAHTQGLSLCNSIEALKMRGISKQTSSTLTTSTSDTIAYPRDLKLYCKKLSIILDIFNNIIANAKQYIRQLEAISKLSENTVFFRTWPFAQFLHFAIDLEDCYTKDKKIKEWVMTRLPHCETAAQLIQCKTAWQYSMFVDDYMDISFRFLMEEIKMIKSGE